MQEESTMPRAKPSPEGRGRAETSGNSHESSGPAPPAPVPVTRDQPLAPNEREAVLRMMAQFMGVKAIMRELARLYGRLIKESQLYDWRHRHKQEIQELRDEFMRAVQDIPLAHTKLRLQELSELYRVAKRDNVLWAQLQVLRDIREEVAPIMEEVFPSGTTEEARAFVEAYLGGQSGVGRLPGGTGPQDTD